jgi:hypothetical protein
VNSTGSSPDRSAWRLTASDQNEAACMAVAANAVRLSKADRTQRNVATSVSRLNTTEKHRSTLPVGPKSAIVPATR